MNTSPAPDGWNPDAWFITAEQYAALPYQERKEQRKRDRKAAEWILARKHELETNAEEVQRKAAESYERNVLPAREDCRRVLERYAAPWDHTGYRNVYGWHNNYHSIIQ